MYGENDFPISDIQSCGERIEQLRRQLVVHSCLYYEMTETLISDKDFDDRAYELVELQTKHPHISRAVPYEEKAFREFDGSTGFNLPFRNHQTWALAEALLIRHQKEN